MSDKRPVSMLTGELEGLVTSLDRTLAAYEPRLELGEIGHVTAIGSGVATVTGFTELRANELLAFPDGLYGIAADLEERRVGAIMLGDEGAVREGAVVRSTGRVVDVPIGEALLGRVIDALGRPLDERGSVRTGLRAPVERTAPPIMHRAPVSTPLQTGIKAIDAAIPIGRGQRELIVGDRQTGKTSIALDTILNQRDTGVLSVYCAIGQRASAVARVIHALREADALDRTVVVVASGEDAPGLQYIAPYAATSIAEAFMAQGEDVLIVYDDLTRHARAYRELSLLLRRPPGREAFPGDVFYLHARLLERATHLLPEHGGGSLTALPIIETQARNLSAFIPTNLISITDGQIYLSPRLFEKGQLPAIDIGKSVSRVGGKAQLPAYRVVAGDLRLSFAQFEELETFSRFGTRLDAETRHKLERGRRVREVLRQAERAHFSAADQIAVLLATTSGLLDRVPLTRIDEAQERLRTAMATDLSELAAALEEGAHLHAKDRQAMLERFRLAVHGLAAEGP
ncbi:MAG: alternate F1F0 ATPase, F1 subunit alpha [Pseudomonadota bacterium]